MSKKISFYFSYDDTFTGAPRVVYNFVRKIDKERFTPLVITNKKSELTEYLDDEGVEYVIVPQPLQIGDQDGEAVRGGILKRASALRQAWIYNSIVRKILDEHECDLLWVRNIKGVLLTGLAANRCRIPLIWDIGMENTSRGFVRLLHNFGFRRATKVITESECVAKSIFTEAQLVKNKSKLDVVKSGIPDNRVQEIKQLLTTVRRVDDDMKIINIATICRRKNQAMIIRSVLPLIDEFPNIKVAFVGPFIEEDYAAELKDMIANAGAEKHFEFLGWRSDATDLLVNSDIFVLGSYVEGVPYSVLESMHARIPVVATRCGGVPDVVIDGVTGLSMEIDDDQAMTLALRTLISDGQKAQKFAETAEQYILQNHTSDKWCASYMDLFDQLIADNQ